jgi:hypothetical protein
VKPNCAANETPPTITYQNSVWAQLFEFQNVNSVTPVDQMTTGAYPLSFPTPDNAAGELLFGVFYENHFGSGGGGTLGVVNFLDSTGLQISGTFNQQSTVFGEYYANVFGIAGITGSVSHILNIVNTVTGRTPYGVFVSLLPTVSPPTPPPVLQPFVGPSEFYVGDEYLGQTLVCWNGQPPYTFSIASGSLPPGVTLSGSQISGMPTTAGTYNFTVQVVDSLSRVNQLGAQFKVLAKAPVLYDTTAISGSGTYYPPDTGSGPGTPDPNFTGGPYNSAYQGEWPWINQNVWGPVGGQTQELIVYSVSNWEILSSITNSAKSVTTFPNTGYNYWPTPWESFSYWYGGWDVYMDYDASWTASACYDMFIMDFGPIVGYVNEVMWHYVERNRGNPGPLGWFAQNVPFGGYTVNGQYIPVTYWNLTITVNDVPATATYISPTKFSWSGTTAPSIPAAPDHAYISDLANPSYLPAGATVVSVSGSSGAYVITTQTGVSPSITGEEVWIGRAINQAYWLLCDGQSQLISNNNCVVDIKAMMQYLLTHSVGAGMPAGRPRPGGIIAPGMTFYPGIGFEVCDTGGNIRRMRYNSMFMHAG